MKSRRRAEARLYPENQMNRSLATAVRHIILFLLCGALIAMLACAKKPAGKSHELEGRVVGVDSAAHTLTIAHKEVPGLMPAMTMPFQVGQKDDWIFGKIAPGDQVHATLVISDHAELQDISFANSSNVPSDGTSTVRVPEAGDAVRDFAFVNQADKKIHLSQFRGKPVLLTFIDTRCPLPEFCLRMSNNFSEVLKRLKAEPTVYAKTQLLSISINPEFDTPKVLREYGSRYVGAVDPKFEHWEFVSGSPKQIREAADFFGLSYDKQSGQIVHNLRTVLIGKDGKIVKLYTGNAWTPEEVAGDYEQAAQ